MVYVALLRGINVGGNRKVPMAQLRKTFESIGMGNVQSYIASGNLLFSTGMKNEIFNQLSEGGKTFMPLSKQFWGDTFGMTTDKYGVDWMVNITTKK